MIRRFFFLLATLLLLATPAHATRQVDWKNLTPPFPDVINPFKGYSSDLLYDIDDLTRIRERFEKGEISKVDPAYEDGVEITARLKEMGLDVDAVIAQYTILLKEIEIYDETIVPELDGKTIKIPGYVLPLEFESTNVREFFLVPYVGACIHTPPPPANQMVLVKLDQSYEPSGLYEPVWITGTMHVEAQETKFMSFDGALDVKSGYVLDAVKIEPFE